MPVAPSADGRGQRAWHFVTGEYPPAPGGVADYARSLARALAAQGDDVHVWAPAVRGEALAQNHGVQVHPLRFAFTPLGLAELDLGLARWKAERIFVHYVPHAFGARGLNVIFPAWLTALAVRRSVWTMFHEVALPTGTGSMRLRAAAQVSERMATLVARASKQAFVSTSAWNPTLRRLVPRLPDPIVIPIPSNLPEPDPARVAALRAQLTGHGPVLGHFGTYGWGTTDTIEKVIAELEYYGSKTVVLLGRGGEAFARRLGSLRALRIVAPGALDAPEIANHLAACDFAIQPYPDGVTTRRTTVMAPLALGLPTITNAGRLTESLWREVPIVRLVSSSDAGALVGAVEDLRAEPEEARLLGAAAAEAYRDRFSMSVTVATLRRIAEFS